METKPYLDYLDKEMTIMGVLSAVCVAAPAAILNTVLAKEGTAHMFWDSGKVFVVSGSIFCIFAALFFYKERSGLAWYYGQICLADTRTDSRTKPRRLRKWLRDADSWDTWWPYSWGFTFLNAGFAQYLLAIIFALRPGYSHKIWIAFYLCIALAIAVVTVQWYVLSHYPLSDNPWKRFRTRLVRFLAQCVRKTKIKPRLPHDGVYTRLRPSATHGIGVFAIIAIPKGKYVFEPDDGELVSVSTDEVKELAPVVRKLYEDFCPLNGGRYACPSSLNLLTPSWFLNKSKQPNVEADSSLKFYAIRDIAADEELTADYDAYSENETKA